MYILGATRKEGAPPVLLNLKGEPIIEGNHVIGSTVYVNKNFQEVGNISDTVYFPDPQWKIYPKNQYPSAYDMYPIGYAFTTYEVINSPNHYLYYLPGKSKASQEYANLLRNNIISSFKKPEPIYSAKKKKELENKMRNLSEELKIKNKKQDSIKNAILRQERIDKRSGVVSIDVEKNKIIYNNLSNEILDIKSKIENIKRDLKLYKIKKV